MDESHAIRVPMPASMPIAAPADPDTDPTVAELIDEYLHDAGDRLAPKSLESSKATLADFGRFAGSLRVSQCRPDLLRRWVRLHPNWKSGATRKSQVARVRAVFGEALTKWQRIPRDPFAGVCYQSDERREPVTEDEYQKLRRACSQASFRDMLEFFWLTGMRPDEAVNLRVDELDLHAGVISQQKHKTARRTGKRRELPVRGYQDLESLLARVLKRRQKWLRTGRIAQDFPYIFATQTGRQWVVSRSLGLKMRRLRKAAGLARPVTCYWFRHGLATRLLAAGVPDQIVAAILGHASTAMLKRYTHASVTHLAEALQRGSESRSRRQPQQAELPGQKHLF